MPQDISSPQVSRVAFDAQYADNMIEEASKTVFELTQSGLKDAIRSNGEIDQRHLNDAIEHAAISGASYAYTNYIEPLIAQNADPAIKEAAEKSTKTALANIILDDFLSRYCNTVRSRGGASAALAQETKTSNQATLDNASRNTPNAGATEGQHTEPTSMSPEQSELILQTFAYRRSKRDEGNAILDDSITKNLANRKFYAGTLATDDQRAATDKAQDRKQAALLMIAEHNNLIYTKEIKVDSNAVGKIVDKATSAMSQEAWTFIRSIELEDTSVDSGRSSSLPAAAGFNDIPAQMELLANKHAEIAVRAMEPWLADEHAEDYESTKNMLAKVILSEFLVDMHKEYKAHKTDSIEHALRAITQYTTTASAIRSEPVSSRASNIFDEAAINELANGARYGSEELVEAGLADIRARGDKTFKDIANRINAAHIMTVDTNAPTKGLLDDDYYQSVDYSRLAEDRSLANAVYNLQDSMLSSPLATDHNPEEERTEALTRALRDLFSEKFAQYVEADLGKRYPNLSKAQIKILMSDENGPYKPGPQSQIRAAVEKSIDSKTAKEVMNIVSRAKDAGSKASTIKMHGVGQKDEGRSRFYDSDFAETLPGEGRLSTHQGTESSAQNKGILNVLERLIIKIASAMGRTNTKAGRLLEHNITSKMGERTAVREIKSLIRNIGNDNKKAPDGTDGPITARDDSSIATAAPHSRPASTMSNARASNVRTISDMGNDHGLS